MEDIQQNRTSDEEQASGSCVAIVPSNALLCLLSVTSSGISNADVQHFSLERLRLESGLEEEELQLPLRKRSS